MSKRNSDGEVLSNKIAVGFAPERQQKLLASLLGGSIAPVAAESHDEQPAEQANIADLKGDGDDEQFGIGAIVPREVQDGSFTNRIPTSHERLLENIIGKKAAKAHLASKQKHKASTKPQKPVRPQPTEEDSEEEEGRAAAFKSKRQKRTKPEPVPRGESEDEDKESRTFNIASKDQKTAGPPPNEEDEDVTMANGPGEEDSHNATQVTSTSRPQKTKPKSYLDEILGEKSKKKKKKKKGKGSDTKIDE